MKNKIVLLRSIALTFVMLLSTIVKAQSVSVSGTVVDTHGEAIVGANVIIKGTTNGTVTDIDGKFNIVVPNKDVTLFITFLGFEELELPASSDLGRIVLHDNFELLDDVLVIGYGQVKKSDATGSVLNVKPDQLNKGSQISAQDALVGKVAGVNVIPATGEPGSGATIRVRMGSSLSASNDPLIVIDGVPVDNSSITGTSNIIGSINPNDIESFTVLKDASSTAIYGSRASNGVIIITTKKGSQGLTRPKFNYSDNFTISTVSDYIDVLNADEYRDVFAKYANAPDDFKLGNADVDWQKEIFRVAFGQEHNLSMTGAAASMPYRISIGYTNQNGIIDTNNYNRVNIGVGLSPKFLDEHLSVDLNVKGSVENNTSVPSGIVGSAVSMDPTRPIHESYDSNVGLGYFTWMAGGAPIAIAPVNPVSELKLTDYSNKIKRSIGNVTFDYKIHGFEDLRANLNVGYDVLNSDYSKDVPQYAPSMYTENMKDGRGLAYDKNQKKKNSLLDFYLNYGHTFNDVHTLNVMAGYGWQHFWKKSHDSQFDTEGNELTSPTHSESEYYLLSYYGRLNYNYDDRYLLTATFRADASSRFAEDNRWGYFPSAAFAWRISNEGSLRDSRVVSDLKLRLSVGQTGQQDIGSDYPAISTYTASYDESRYKMGDKWYTTYRPDGYDPNIKWETTMTYNIGFDWGFVNNRISGSVDIYKRKTEDLLNDIYIPAGSNFTNMIYTNIGSMKNKGLEISVNAIPVKTSDFEWSIGANFTWNDSEITKLNTIDTDDNYVKTGNMGGTKKEIQVHKVGETPYTFFTLKQAYDDNGKPLDGQYYDKNGELTTSEEDSNKYVTGKSSQAPYYCGFSTKFIYKNFDLGMNGHGSFGNYVFNYVKASESLDDLYSSQGTSSNILKSTVETGFTQQRLFTDYFLENASFFRFDNITLGYTFNKLWNDSSSLRLSGAIQNVGVITGYSGVDPEIQSGIDRNVYQRPRVFMFGLNLNF